MQLQSHKKGTSGGFREGSTSHREKEGANHRPGRPERDGWTASRAVQAAFRRPPCCRSRAAEPVHRGRVVRPVVRPVMRPGTADASPGGSGVLGRCFARPNDPVTKYTFRKGTCPTDKRKQGQPPAEGAAILHRNLGRNRPETGTGAEARRRRSGFVAGDGPREQTRLRTATARRCRHARRPTTARRRRSATPLLARMRSCM